MSFDSRLGEFAGSSSRSPSLDPFPPHIYFLELTIEFSASHYKEYLRFIPRLCLDGNHQGAVVAHKTTHDKYLRLHKFISIWDGPDMVGHMLMTMAHEFIHDN